MSIDMPDPANEPESRQKKRARDRRAQQNVRDKRAAHLQSLEKRTAALEIELQALRQECSRLRQENQTLEARQETIHGIVASWGCAVSSTGSASNGYDQIEAISLLGAQLPTASKSMNRSLLHWQIVPVHTSHDIFMTDALGQLFRSPELVYTSPETPEPLELLYGSKLNLLANGIYDSMRMWPCRDPERLASGWLSYHLLKWIFQPSESHYSRLYYFQTPVPDQVRHPHPHFVDFVVWPTIRTNMIKNHHKYRLEDIVGMLTCCLKVRWPWNKPFLEPNASGELLLNVDFYNTFTSLEGWGLTADFTERFPALFENVDTAAIQYDFN